jgi:hypothetical protein
VQPSNPIFGKSLANSTSPSHVRCYSVLTHQNGGQYYTDAHKA